MTAGIPRRSSAWRRGRSWAEALPPPKFPFGLGQRKHGERSGVLIEHQQLVKNLFLWGGRSYVRKALEFPLALWLDLVLPKRRVLEIYLNVAEWGPNGEFGAEAAARYAFSKSARDLTAREAMLLAAILPNPRRRSARHPGSTVRRLASIYESRAARVGAAAACVRTTARVQ